MENWIKTNREALGLSQAKLAAALGVGSSTVNTWEHGERKPSAKVWPKLAAFFQEHGLEAPPMPDDLPNGRQTFQRSSMGTAPGKLKEKREAAGMSVAALAAVLGFNRHSVTDWESGKSVPSKKAIEALAELFQCPPEELGFPRIKNGLTVEERNTLMLDYLEDIHKAVYGMRRLMYASRTEQEDARQDAALAVLEAIGKAENPDDPEALRRYVFSTVKGALLSSVKRSNDQGLAAVPYGVYITTVPLERVIGLNLDDEWD